MLVKLPGISQHCALSDPGPSSCPCLLWVWGSSQEAACLNLPTIEEILWFAVSAKSVTLFKRHRSSGGSLRRESIFVKGEPRASGCADKMQRHLVFKIEPRGVLCIFAVLALLGSLSCRLAAAQDNFQESCCFIEQDVDVVQHTSTKVCCRAKNCSICDIPKAQFLLDDRQGAVVNYFTGAYMLTGPLHVRHCRWSLFRKV
eukprot:1315316-Rhodomonas_salina.2